MGVAERAVAEAFVAARREGRALEVYPGKRPGELTEAYAIQDAALAIWDRPVGGWKVGKINAPLDEQLGANRLAGPAFVDAIFRESEGPSAMPVFEHGFAAAEAEFMLRLAPPDDAAPPVTNAEAREWVDEIRVGLEIASSPYPGINRDGPCVTISDHGNNAGLLLGRQVPPESWDDLDSIDVTLKIGGRLVGRATTATMLDGPFGAVRFLLGNLAQRGIAVQPGWWVSTGAITGVHEVAIGDEVTAGFGSLGEISAKIVAHKGDRP